MTFGLDAPRRLPEVLMEGYAPSSVVLLDTYAPGQMCSRMRMPPCQAALLLRNLQVDHLAESRLVGCHLSFLYCHVSLIRICGRRLLQIQLRFLWDSQVANEP